MSSEPPRPHHKGHLPTRRHALLLCWLAVPSFYFLPFALGGISIIPLAVISEEWGMNNWWRQIAASFLYCAGVFVWWGYVKIAQNRWSLEKTKKFWRMSIVFNEIVFLFLIYCGYVGFRDLSISSGDVLAWTLPGLWPLVGGIISWRAYHALNKELMRTIHPEDPSAS